ncbi:MAG: release factor glutamine methyltransferase [Actinomycetota bacterium]|nr:release factor glutamine methyltransferase [Actinomycetota bacterium]
MAAPVTVEELLALGTRVLSDSTHIFEDHDNELEARMLMASVLSTPEDGLPLARRLTPRMRDRYLALIARRAAGEPTPLLTGHIEFYGLDLKVKAGPFVPRPSSELMVDQAVKRLRRFQDPVMVDICTGAGPIALAVADELKGADVWGSDIAAEGLRQARSNARRLNITNVSFARGDMYSALPARLRGGVDVVTGHVPYVPFGELDDLPTEVREHEPISTLSDESSPDGLDLMRRAVKEAPEWLGPGGWLMLEMSDDVAGEVEEMCLDAGFVEVGTITDDDELSVVVEGRIPKRQRPPR